jgi:hypothetical protein
MGDSWGDLRLLWLAPVRRARRSAKVKVDNNPTTAVAATRQPTTKTTIQTGASIPFRASSTLSSTNGPVSKWNALNGTWNEPNFRSVKEAFTNTFMFSYRLNINLTHPPFTTNLSIKYKHHNFNLVFQLRTCFSVSGKYSMANKEWTVVEVI